MKAQLLRFASFVIGLAVCAAHGQFAPHAGMGGPPPGPRLGGGDMAKIFGENSAFTADLEFHMNNSGEDMIIPGKVALLDGKSRFEMSLSGMKNSKMPPAAIAHMKTMGMDQMVMISRPDKKVFYQLYPQMQAYVENPIQDPKAITTEADYKIEVTELGKETIDGHECVKNKVVLTDKDGKSHESTVWNAGDLNKFPLKIETSDGASSSVMLFKNVKLEKPDAPVFDPPANSQKYESVMALMMSKMGGMQMPPPR